MNEQSPTREDLLTEVRSLRERLAAQEGAGGGPGRDEESYRLLFEANPLPMWVLEHATLTFLAVNRATLRHYGYSREEFLALTALDIRPHEEVEPFVRYAREAAPPGQHKGLRPEGVWRHRKKDGTLIDVEITRSAISFRGREAFLVLANDVTERRRAEQSLRHSEELNRRILQAMPGGVVTVGPDHAILQANEEAQRILGLSWDEMSRRFVPDWETQTVCEDGSPCPVADYPVSKCLATGQPQPPTVIGVRRPDGETSWAVFTAVPLLGAGTGRPAGAVVTFLDITGRKRAEEQLAESARRLEALSRRLLQVQEQEQRHLARELHDEIGQVVTALQLNLELCTRLTDEKERRVRLDTARALVRDLAGRVRDLSLRLRPAVLDDLGLLATLLWHFERYTAQTGVRVHFEHRGLGCRFDPEVETAAYRIVQEALTNVARHAGVSEVSVRVKSEGDLLTVRVEDEGAGFHPARHRAGSSGLPGIGERAALLGGRLGVESAQGSGTRLTVELPVGGPGQRGTR